MPKFQGKERVNVRFSRNITKFGTVVEVGKNCLVGVYLDDPKWIISTIWCHVNFVDLIQGERNEI